MRVIKVLSVEAGHWLAEQRLDRHKINAAGVSVCLAQSVNEYRRTHKSTEEKPYFLINSKAVQIQPGSPEWVALKRDY